MTNLSDLLATLTSADPGRPRITWYAVGGPSDGERVELAGAVLANWASKAANLLQDELEAEPGTRVHLAMPPHWRTLYWAVATWAVGGVLVADADDADIVVGTGASPAPAVLVTLPALARSADGPVPAGAIDEARELATYGDAFHPMGRPAGDALAIEVPAVLMAGIAARSERAVDLADDDTLAWVTRAAARLVGGGSTVLVRVAGPLDDDTQDRLDRIADQERAEPPAH